MNRIRLTLVLLSAIFLFSLIFFHISAVTEREEWIRKLDSLYSDGIFQSVQFTISHLPDSVVDVHLDTLLSGIPGLEAFYLFMGNQLRYHSGSDEVNDLLPKYFIQGKQRIILHPYVIRIEQLTVAERLYTAALVYRFPQRDPWIHLRFFYSAVLLLLIFGYIGLNFILFQFRQLAFNNRDTNRFSFLHFLRPVSPKKLMEQIELSRKRLLREVEEKSIQAEALNELSFPCFIVNQHSRKVHFANQAALKQFGSVKELYECFSEEINLFIAERNNGNEVQINTFDVDSKIQDKEIKGQLSISLRLINGRSMLICIYIPLDEWKNRIVIYESRLQEYEKNLQKLQKKIIISEQDRLKLEKNSYYRYFLLETISELSRINELSQMAELLISKMHDYFHISFGSFYIYHEEKHQFELIHQHFFSGNSYLVPEKLNARDTFVKKFLQQNFPFILEKEHLNEMQYKVNVDLTEVHSQGMVLPVTEQEKPLGLIVLFKAGDSVFIMEEINVLDALSKHISIILHNRLLVTELNQRNAELQKALDELKRSQSQILQLQKMESLGRLVGGIAHDFNNILGIILPTTELMFFSQNLSAADKEKLEMIRVAASRGAELTKQLLIFSREQKAVLRSMELNQFFRENLNLFSKFLDENIILQFQPWDSEVWIKGDKNQLFQVVSNLIVNAVDAIREIHRKKGHIRVVVFSSGQMEKFSLPVPETFRHRGYGGFFIQDNGCGIEPEIRERIFDPFFSTKDVGKGTGLGLSIVYAVIKNQHGGEILVESEPGEGSRFIIYLPESGAEESRITTYESEFLATGHEYILVIDDEEFIRLSQKFLLEKLGYKVFLAENGKKGIELLKSNPGIDLAIVDYAMPLMNGFETISRLKQIKPDLAVILATGYMEDIHSTEMQKMIDNLSMKPFDIYELSQTIRRVLDKKKRKSINGAKNGKG